MKQPTYPLPTRHCQWCFHLIPEEAERHLLAVVWENNEYTYRYCSDSCRDSHLANLIKRGDTAYKPMLNTPRLL